METYVFLYQRSGVDSIGTLIRISRNDLKIIEICALQATRRQVFLVDVVQLDIANEDWNQLGRQIFNNMEILKLGTCV